MVAPLLIAAAVAGAARAAGGIVGAGKKARRDRSLIKRAYKIAQVRQEQEQGYTRQDQNEELNRRGVLTAGAAAPRLSGPIAGAYANFDTKRMALSSVAGEQGPANSLSGQVNRNMSDEFFREQNDLWQARGAGINATKAQQANDTLGAINAGVQLGTSVYTGGKTLGSLGGPAAGGAAGAGAAKNVTIRGAFGISPTDPLGLNEQNLSNYAFNTRGR